MKPIVFEPTPGPFAADGDVQEVEAEEAADVQTTARSSARRLPAAMDFLLRRFMRFLSMRGRGGTRGSGRAPRARTGAGGAAARRGRRGSAGRGGRRARTDSRGIRVPGGRSRA